MSTLTKNTIRINQSVDRVFDFATNMENFNLWFPGVLNIYSGNAIDHGQVGKEYLETIKIPFKGKNIILLKVVESIKNEVFSTEGDFRPLLPKMTMKFSQNSFDQTMFTWSMQSRNSNPIFKISLLPVFKQIIRGRAKEGVLNLKKILEKL